MSAPPPKTLVIMPALNEELAIAAVIGEVRATLPYVHVLVVDDGSRDRTAAVARSAGARVASLPFNLGVGAAMRTGYRYARDCGYDAAVQVDADGQHDPASIAALVAKLDDADIVLGARFAGVGDYQVRGPRRWAMSVLSAVLSRVCGTRLTDTTSGFRATGPRAISLFAEHFPAEYLGDTVEALVIARRHGLVVRQVPVAMRPRAAGEPSHNPFKAAMSLVRAVVALAFALLRPRSAYGGSYST